MAKKLAVDADEYLSKTVFFGEDMLRRAIAEFVEHFHTERRYQGLGNRLLRPGPTLPVTEGTSHRHVRLDGLLSFYHRHKRRAASGVLRAGREKVIDVGFAAAAGPPVCAGPASAVESAPGMDRASGTSAQKCTRLSSRTTRQPTAY